MAIIAHIVPYGEHKVERVYVKPHTLWLPNQVMDEEEITFALLGKDNKIENVDENIAITPPMRRRSVGVHRRRTTQTIGDIITLNMFTRAFSTWCTPHQCSPTILCATRRCSEIYR